jgi:type II secretory pathway pseudopilin PulG
MAKSTIKSSDDKILFYYYKATEYFEANRQKVYIIIGVLAVVILGTIFYMMSKRSANESASLELSKTQQIYDQGLYTQAINGDSLNTTKGLLFIVNEYGSTEAGETAKILLGNSYYFLRDFDSADRWYKDYSGGNKIYKAAALAGVAAVFEAKENYIEAAKQFEKAATYDKEIATNDENLFYAARNYSKANDAAGFKRVYDMLKKDYPKSPWLATAERFKI